MECLEQIAAAHKRSAEKLAHDFIIYCIDRIEIERGRDRKWAEEGRPRPPHRKPVDYAAYAAEREKALAIKREGNRARATLLRSKGLCTSCGHPKEPHRMGVTRCQRCKDRHK